MSTWELLPSSMTRRGTELKKVAHTEVVDREYCLSGSQSSLLLVHSHYSSTWHVHTHRNQQKPIEIWRSSVWVVLSRLSQPLPSGVCTWLSSRALRATRFTAQLPVYTTHNKLCFPKKNLHRHCLIVLFLLTWTTGTGWFVFFFFTETTVIIRRDWKQ